MSIPKNRDMLVFLFFSAIQNRFAIRGPLYCVNARMTTRVLQRIIVRISTFSLEALFASRMIYENVIAFLVLCKRVVTRTIFIDKVLLNLFCTISMLPKISRNVTSFYYLPQTKMEAYKSALIPNFLFAIHHFAKKDIVSRHTLNIFLQTPKLTSHYYLRMT